MSSQHRDPPLTVRPPADVKTQAQAVLNARNLEVQAFVVACLSALAATPDQFLAGLKPHWPEQKPRGRPRRTPGSSSDDQTDTVQPSAADEGDIPAPQ
ncbi:hypothetical protein [Actinacidiphila oryziradicis]|uniref:hypothetical protein n=1 Tax=Actinacidiphila oryziradicis TaxID=2571141 RepID=UPI001B803DE5|nr:hypothetical protein [Actinacidiphila oryziradicis]